MGSDPGQRWNCHVWVSGPNGSNSLSDVVPGRPHPYDLALSVTAHGASQRRPDVLGRGSPGGDRLVPHRDHDHHHGCASEASGGWREIELREPEPGLSIPRRFRAGSPLPPPAHVVADPSRWRICPVHHAVTVQDHAWHSAVICFEYGLWVPRPWTTPSAQHVGLDWSATRELISRARPLGLRARGSRSPLVQDLISFLLSA